MLSSKKTSLVSCLLKSFASDASHCSHHPSSPSSPATGDHSAHQLVSNKSTSAPQSYWAQLLSMCVSSSLRQSTPAPHTLLPNTSHQSPLAEEAKRRLELLSRHQLELLWRVIQAQGNDAGECILVSHTPWWPQRRCDQCDMEYASVQQIAPHLLVGLLWRWRLAEIDQRRLRPMPCCSHHSHDLMWDELSRQQLVCINPYHWSLLISTEYEKMRCLYPMMPADRGPLGHDCPPPREPSSPHGDQYYPIPSSTPPPSYSEAYNQLAGVVPHKWDSPKSIVPNKRWCTLTYWEQRNRVGDPFRVCSKSVDVCVGAADGQSFCLVALFKSRQKVSASVSDVRSKIGLGISIFRDANNCVYLYNRSSSSIFVNSHTLNPAQLFSNSAESSSVKVLPGRCVKAYDFGEAQQLRSFLQANTHTPPDDQNHPHFMSRPSSLQLLDNPSISLSFHKGFGRNYSRQEIMQCPCWMEVILDFANQRPLSPLSCN